MEIKEIKNIDTMRQSSTLYVDVFNNYPWNDNWNLEVAGNRLSDFFLTPRFIGFCAYENEQIIGCVIGNIEKYYNGDYFYLKEMFVSGSFQRKGIGKMLLDRLKERLKELKIASIILFTSNKYFPIYFYKEKGFKTLDYMNMMSLEL